MEKFDEKNALKFLKMICDASNFLNPTEFAGYPSDKAWQEFYLGSSRKRLEIFVDNITNYVSRIVLFPFESYPFRGLSYPPVNCLAVKNGRYDKKIWICGHHDYCAALGAEDNAAALAIMVELARCLEDEKLNHTLCFVSFDLEEKGQVGAVNMASHLQKTGELSKIKYLINLDCVGQGRDVLVCKSVGGAISDDGLVSVLLSSAYKCGYEFIERKDCWWVADHIPFAACGVKTVQLSSADGWGNDVVHNKNDIPENISLGNLKMVGEVMLEAIRILDKT